MHHHTDKRDGIYEYNQKHPDDTLTQGVQSFTIDAVYNTNVCDHTWWYNATIKLPTGGPQLRRTPINARPRLATSNTIAKVKLVRPSCVFMNLQPCKTGSHAACIPWTITSQGPLL